MRFYHSGWIRMGFSFVWENDEDIPTICCRRKHTHTHTNTHTSEFSIKPPAAVLKNNYRDEMV